MSIFVKDYQKTNRPLPPPPMKSQGHQPEKVTSRPAVPKGLSTGARKKMNESKPYFSIYLNLNHCNDAMEKFDELDKYRKILHNTFGDSINCFIFPTESESRVECVSPVFIAADDSLQKKMDEITSNLKKLIEESK